MLMISETRLDESFPKGQFLIKGFRDPHRLDRNSKGGKIIMFIREDIPSKLLSMEKIQSKLFMQKLTSEKSNGCFVVLIMQIRTILMPI